MQSSDSEVQADDNNEEGSDIAGGTENFDGDVLSMEGRRNCQENKSSRT